jgi:hypothetical protein
VTSREKTNLPSEHIEEIYGLEDAMGGALFYENVSTRKDALTETGLEKLSADAACSVMVTTSWLKSFARIRLGSSKRPIFGNIMMHATEQVVAPRNFPGQRP